MPSLSEAPSGGVRALGYLGLFQVTRRKGGTLSRHHPNNGYTPNASVPLQDDQPSITDLKNCFANSGLSTARAMSMAPAIEAMTCCAC